VGEDLPAVAAVLAAEDRFSLLSTSISDKVFCTYFLYSVCAFPELRLQLILDFYKSA